MARTALLFIHADGDAVARPANQRHMGSMTEKACDSWTAKKCCRFGTKSIFVHDGASKSQLVSGGGAAEAAVGRKAEGSEKKKKVAGKSGVSAQGGGAASDTEDGESNHDDDVKGC